MGVTVTQLLVFKVIAKTVSALANDVTFQSEMYDISSSLFSHQHLMLALFFYLNHPDRFIVNTLL